MKGRLIRGLILTLLLSACLGGTPQPPGKLAGHVNIGPLVPVQRG